MELIRIFLQLKLNPRQNRKLESRKQKSVYNKENHSPEN